MHHRRSENNVLQAFGTNLLLGRLASLVAFTCQITICFAQFKPEPFIPFLVEAYPAGSVGSDARRDSLYMFELCHFDPRSPDSVISPRVRLAGPRFL